MVSLTMTDYLTRGQVRPVNRDLSYWRDGPPAPPPGGVPGDANPNPTK